MPTSGQALSLRQNINSYVALVFVASFALMFGLIIWHTAFGENPLANALTQTSLANSDLY